MADSTCEIEEIRFNFRDEDLTEVFVLVKQTDADILPGIQGWHHKTFSAKKSIDTLLGEIAAGHLLWPLQAPTN